MAELEMPLMDVIRLLEEHKENGAGRTFAVTFVKRTNGEVRHMVCRFDVKSHLKGGTLAYDPAEKRLMTVFDMQKLDYRSINLDSVIQVKMNGKLVKVTDNPFWTEYADLAAGIFTPEPGELDSKS